MTGAAELIANIQMELEPINQKIVNHRYLTALEKGEVKRESLTFFAAQQYHIISRRNRNCRNLLDRDKRYQFARLGNRRWFVKGLSKPLSSGSSLHDLVKATG